MGQVRARAQAGVCEGEWGGGGSPPTTQHPGAGGCGCRPGDRKDGSAGVLSGWREGGRVSLSNPSSGKGQLLLFPVASLPG